MEDNGWNVDVTQHNEKQCVRGRGFEECERVAKYCDRGTFYGHNLREDNRDGTVSAKLKGNGAVDIFYGNCGTNGDVTLTINGKVFDIAKPATNKILTNLPYKDGDILEFKVTGDAVIKMTKIKFH